MCVSAMTKQSTAVCEHHNETEHCSDSKGFVNTESEGKKSEMREISRTERWEFLIGREQMLPHNTQITKWVDHRGQELTWAKTHHHKLLAHKRLEINTNHQAFYILSGSRGWVGALGQETLRDAGASPHRPSRARPLSAVAEGGSTQMRLGT